MRLTHKLDWSSPTTRGLAMLLLALHLGLVVCGAAKTRLPSLGPFNPVIARYLGFSGAHYSWGFFAPNIGTQFKTEFEIRMKDGSIRHEQLGSRGPNEVLLRQTGIAATFWYGMREEKVRRSLAASWAADVFNRTPGASRVEVRVSAYFIPSTRQVREGAKPRWAPVYDAAFVGPAALADKGYPKL